MRREDELASGHEELRFAGYVTRERTRRGRARRRVRRGRAGRAAGAPRPAAPVGRAGHRLRPRRAADRTWAARARSGRGVDMRRRLGERHGHRATTANAAGDLSRSSPRDGLGDGGVYIGHRPARRGVHLRPVRALRAASRQQPEPARRRRGRLGQVVARQDLPVPPGACSAGCPGSRTRRASTRRSRDALGVEPIRLVPGRRRPAQPDHPATPAGTRSSACSARSPRARSPAGSSPRRKAPSREALRDVEREL